MRTSEPIGSALRFLVLVASSATVAACGGATFSGTSPGNDAGTHKDAAEPGDDAQCELVQIVNPVLTVTDQTTGAHICDATLVDNDAGSGLYTVGSGSTCTYKVSEFGGNSGTFTVTIGAPGYDSAKVTGLQVSYCGCDTSSCPPAQQVGVSLVPAPPGQDGGVDAGHDGGSTDGSVDGGGGTDGGMDSGLIPACPVSAPSDGAPCGTTGLECEYGTNANPYCNGLFQCVNGVWASQTVGSTCAVGGTCSAYSAMSQGETCSAVGQTCGSADGTCVCTNDPGGLPISGGPVWSCTAAETGCPSPRPLLGSPCSADASLSCDYGACSGGVVERCAGGAWALDDAVACEG